MSSTVRGASNMKL